MWAETREYQVLVEKLSLHPRFIEMWNKSAELENNLVYTDQAVTTFRHPRLGSVKVVIWWTRLLKDNRLFVSNYWPVAPEDRRAFDVVASVLALPG
jgi:hypothetical protein